MVTLESERVRQSGQSGEKIALFYLQVNRHGLDAPLVSQDRLSQSCHAQPDGPRRVALPFDHLARTWRTKLVTAINAAALATGMMLKW